jgi:predicted amidohydrolase
LLGQMLSEADSDQEAALAVLALLVAIDERMGHYIRKDYYTRPEGTAVSVAVGRDRAMPKPWPAFGTASTPFHELAPGTGVDARRLFLEHQFGRVLAPLSLAGPEGPRPALHRLGEPSSLEGALATWSVAAVDVLSTFDELQLGEDADHFWLSAYSADEVQERVWERLDWVLEVCREAGTQLIVVPELTLSRKLVARTAARLGEWAPSASTGLLPMVIAGRLHEPLTGQEGRFRNRPAVITPDGELLWDYWKMRPFQAAGLRGLWEACGPAPEYVLAIDTPLGRVAVTICLDFPDFHIQAVLRELRANVVVVPAMTPGRTVQEVFYDRAVALTTDSRAATVFANSSLHIRAEMQQDEAGNGDGALPRPRTLSFVRGSTSVSAGTPMASHDFVLADNSATVSIYHLHAVPGGRLSVTPDPPRHFRG